MNVAIYMEGGGDSAGSKAELRPGHGCVSDRNQRRVPNAGLALVCCGSRDEAHKYFKNERANGDAGIVVLLVDSEAPVDIEPADHLVKRDRWDDLHGADGEMIHLMVQTMETWIVADRAALNGYYGRSFREIVRARRQNLEEVGKNDVAKGLRSATVGTQKGAYHKIRHARHLLQLIDPMTVRERCRHCGRLFETLLRLINQND